MAHLHIAELVMLIMAMRQVNQSGKTRESSYFASGRKLDVQNLMSLTHPEEYSIRRCFCSWLNRRVLHIIHWLLVMTTQRVRFIATNLFWQTPLAFDFAALIMNANLNLAALQTKWKIGWGSMQFLLCSTLAPFIFAFDEWANIAVCKNIVGIQIDGQHDNFVSYHMNT